MLGAPVRYTFSKDTKESLAGMPPEQLYFGGGREFDRLTSPATAFTAPTRSSCGQPGDRSRYLSDRHSLGHDGRFNAYPPNEPDIPISQFSELSLALKTEKGIV